MVPTASEVSCGLGQVKGRFGAVMISMLTRPGTAKISLLKFKDQVPSQPAREESVSHSDSMLQYWMLNTKLKKKYPIYFCIFTCIGQSNQQGIDRRMYASGH